jgi:hypothetical protein
VRFRQQSYGRVLAELPRSNLIDGEQVIPTPLIMVMPLWWPGYKEHQSELEVPSTSDMATFRQQFLSCSRLTMD